MSMQMMGNQQNVSEKKVKIDVNAAPGTDGRLIDWSYVPHFEGGSGVSNDKHELKFAPKSGAHRLSFSLTDTTGLGLRFYENPRDAMWVTAGMDCPTGPGDGNGAIVFGDKPVKNDLEVTNKNEVEGDLCYSLRFDGARQSSAPPYVFDPIIKNGGGGNFS